MPPDARSQCDGARGLVRHPGAGARPAGRPGRSAQHASEGEEAHDAGWFPTIAKTFNFAVLVGVLVYFLRQPLVGLSVFAHHAGARGSRGRRGDAGNRDAASSRRSRRSCGACPASSRRLKHRGAEEIVAERARIEQAAQVERQRLLEQTRREIEMQLRVARRELVEFAATLAVDVAPDRIKRSITPDDQAAPGRSLHRAAAGGPAMTPARRGRALRARAVRRRAS